MARKKVVYDIPPHLQPFFDEKERIHKTVRNQRRMRMLIGVLLVGTGLLFLGIAFIISMFSEGIAVAVGFVGMVFFIVNIFVGFTFAKMEKRAKGDLNDLGERYRSAHGGSHPSGDDGFHSEHEAVFDFDFDTGSDTTSGRGGGDDGFFGFFDGDSDGGGGFFGGGDGGGFFGGDGDGGGFGGFGGDGDGGDGGGD